MPCVMPSGRARRASSAVSSANWNCRCWGPRPFEVSLKKACRSIASTSTRGRRVFGRRRFGMTPILPQILDHLRIHRRRACHARRRPLPGGQHQPPALGRDRRHDGRGRCSACRSTPRVPKVSSACRTPCPALADMDNQPTVIFAHWPGNTSPWYEDIHRARRYTTVLGSFLTLPDYFERTGMSGHQTAPKADEYRSPYLKQAVAAGQADPISRWVRYYPRRTAAEAVQSLATPGRFGRRQAFGLRRRPLGRYRRLVGDACGRWLAGRAIGRRRQDGDGRLQARASEWATSRDSSWHEPTMLRMIRQGGRAANRLHRTRMPLRPASWWPIP